MAQIMVIMESNDKTVEELTASARTILANATWDDRRYDDIIYWIKTED